MELPELPDSVDASDVVGNSLLWPLEAWLNRFAIYRALGRVLLALVLTGTALLVGAAIVWAFIG